MNKSLKTVTAISAFAAALAGISVPTLAAAQAMPHPGMMQGAQGGPQAAGMPAGGPGSGGCPMGMMGGGMGAGMGMMGGGGMGGMMGGGGMGPGMGMMGGGMGNNMGMMGGGGMGPGMGMMGGGMGSGMGMMGSGMGAMAVPDVTDDQAAQLRKIQADMGKKQRALMRQMWDEQEQLNDLFSMEKRDPAAIGKAYGKLSDPQRQALEARIDAENQMTAVLTKEQKAQMRRGFGRGMMGY